MSLYTEESRIIYGDGFYRPIVATLVTDITEETLANRYAEGFIAYRHDFAKSNFKPEATIPLLARFAVTGSLLPPFGVYVSSGISAPMTLSDYLKLSVELCQFEEFPTQSDYSRGSAYLTARSVIEKVLGLE